MKLRNKLIPLGSVFATCATIAPIALTSCSNGQMVDLLTYTPSEDRAKVDGNKLDQQHGMELYISAIQKDANVFYNDFYNYAKFAIQYQADMNGYTINTLKCKVSDLSVNWTKVGDDTLALANFSISLSLDQTYMNESEYLPGVVSIQETTNGTVTFKNIPLWVNGYKNSGEFSQWYVSPMLIDLTETTSDSEIYSITSPTIEQCYLLDENEIDWSMKCDYKHVETTTYDHAGEYTQDVETYDGSLLADKAQTLMTWLGGYEQDGAWYTTGDFVGPNAVVLEKLVTYTTALSKYMSNIAIDA